MSDDLKHRLRDEEHLQQRHGFQALLATAREAHDRIEELEAALAIAQGNTDAAIEDYNRVRAGLDWVVKWADHELNVCSAARDRSGTIAYSRVLAKLREQTHD